MDRLAELRERRALTLRELSEMGGVAADTINQIELGHRKARPSTLRKLAKALDVDVRELFEEPALSGKAEAPREAGRLPGWATISDPDDFRRVVKNTPTAELEQTALELAKLTKVPTREDLVGNKDNKEAHRRTMANYRISVINVELDSRGVRSPVEHVATRLDDALTPPEEPREEERAG